ncbi:O-antigen ligase family protein [Salinarimonas sp. NSM]|uniref:O-antigen ligase family protein n=1 Tax=Salinarimonas sp. NSM TaxID=3458003 RepID=UPI00403653A7
MTAVLWISALAPVLMVASRGIAPVLLVLATLVALGVAAASRTLETTLAGAARSRGAQLAGAFALYAVVSVAWSPVPERGATFAAHLLGNILLASVAIAAVVRDPPTWPRGLLAGAILVTAALIGVEMAYGSPVRTALDLSQDTYRLNRAAVAIVVLLPLATATLPRRGRLPLAAVLWAAVAYTAYHSLSASALLAYGVAALVLAATLLGGRRMVVALFLALLGVFLAAPIIAPFANDLVPERVHAFLTYGTITIRGEMWREYAALYWLRPIFGYGIEASVAAAELREATGLGAERLSLLAYGHPHNGVLQIWFELGAFGALLAAAALAWVLRRVLAACPNPLLPYAAATVCAVFAVTGVSHGLWQAWWWSFVALVAIGFAAAAGAQRASAASGTTS